MNKLLANCYLAAGLTIAVLHTPAVAADLSPPADLPPRAAVEMTLAAQPMVKAAQAEFRGAQAEHSRLKAGEHEFGLRLTTQRRSISGGPDANEWNAGIERGLRLNGKAGLDDRIGQQEVMAAEERVGDARHESARQLLTLWYAARQAKLEAALWRKQTELLSAQRRIVETRVKRGDAPRLDMFQADAAVAQALSQASAAQARENVALTELRARFPELPAPDDSVVPPSPPPDDAAIWLQRTLAHNHELLAAQRMLDKSRLQLQRAQANRIPDPTLGLHLASEQGGNDKIIGLTLSFPLPGEARRAQTQGQQAQVDAMSEMEAATRRRLAAESSANWQRAVAGVETWQSLEQAATAMNSHADLARRAHELGELGLSDALLARRTLLETQLAAGQARLAANEAIARLLLDAHQLWPMEDHDDHH